MPVIHFTNLDELLRQYDRRWGSMVPTIHVSAGYKHSTRSDNHFPTTTHSIYCDVRAVVDDQIVCYRAYQLEFDHNVMTERDDPSPKQKWEWGLSKSEQTKAAITTHLQSKGYHVNHGVVDIGEACPLVGEDFLTDD